MKMSDYTRLRHAPMTIWLIAEGTQPFDENDDERDIEWTSDKGRLAEFAEGYAIVKYVKAR
jgi:hypothetical protein